MQVYIEIHKTITDSRIQTFINRNINNINKIIDRYKLNLPALKSEVLAKIAEALSNDISEEWKIYYSYLSSGALKEELGEPCLQEAGREIFFFKKNAEPELIKDSTTLEIQTKTKTKILAFDPENNYSDCWVIEKSFLPGVTNSLSAVAHEIISNIIINNTINNNIGSSNIMPATAASIGPAPSQSIRGYLEEQKSKRLAAESIKKDTSKKDSIKTIEQACITVETTQILIGKGEIPALNLLFNPLIEELLIKQAEQANAKKIVFADKSCAIVPQAPQAIQGKGQAEIKDAQIIPIINLTNKELLELNYKLALNLNLPQLEAAQNYFKQKGRDPYDIELETIAQTWSEHCKHNIFSYPIDEFEEGIFKTFIRGATEEIMKNNPNHICASVFSDNAGAIFFDENWLVCAKVETHNSPSALEPYGGAMTGILGVNRDILGFGLGAKPIANYYAFCFNDEDEKEGGESFYQDKNKTRPRLSAAEIAAGVIRGVNVGGNCSGIPTVYGLVRYSKAFLAKPLVFVGSIGLIPREIKIEEKWQSSCLKAPKEGDLIIIIGGRTGRDGIHGATFSSSAISEHNIRGTEVQIGDPFTQKKLSDAIIKEIRDLSLYNAITDNGAGGFSSSIGEMGSLGFHVELEKALLKYKNLAPWEIWVSESQERMTLSVPEKNLLQFIEILKKHDVEYAVIGKFNNSGKAMVSYMGGKILELDCKFLHEGNPPIHLRTKPASNSENDLEINSSDAKISLGINSEVKLEASLRNNLSSTQPNVGSPRGESARSNISRNDSRNELTLDEAIALLLADRNIFGQEFIAKQYDHEVQGGSVLKPLQGKGKVLANATVIRPVLTTNKGLAQAMSLAIISAKTDPYRETAIAIEEAIRNVIIAGANIEKIALLDNFCWSDSNDPERLYQLRCSAQACYDYAIKFQTPFISGKDSMFNDFKGYNDRQEAVHLRNDPTLLITAIGIVDNIEEVISLDAKFPGDLIYILGTTASNNNLKINALEINNLNHNNNFNNKLKIKDKIKDNFKVESLKADLKAKSEANVKTDVKATDCIDTKSCFALYKFYSKAVKAGLIASAIAIGYGGALAALLKKLKAGALGAELLAEGIDLLEKEVSYFREYLPQYLPQYFSGIIITIAPNNQEKLEKIFAAEDHNLYFQLIGRITEEQAIKKGIFR